MAFSNQCIKAPDPHKPHICIRAGLWRVSPYNHKKLWRLGIGDRWIKAHAEARARNALRGSPY